MTIVLDGSGLTCDKLVRIAREGEKVQLAPEALERIKACRALLERKIEQKEIMYGVNTGIGELVNVVLDEDQTRDFQRYLIYNHAAGIGEPAPVEAPDQTPAVTTDRQEPAAETGLGLSVSDVELATERANAIVLEEKFTTQLDTPQYSVGVNQQNDVRSVTAVAIRAKNL